jgi:hypothetical protein
VRCEHVERLVSVAMDDPIARPLPEAEADHARTCPSCRAFAEGAWRIRKAARLAPAPGVPDLAPAIIGRVATEEAGRTRPRPAPRLGLRPRGPGRSIGTARPLRRAVALGLAAGLLIGFVLTGGGILLRRTPASSALAAQIPDRLVGAAEGLRGYRATFDIVERDFAPAVPRRTFVASVAFKAPENMRVRVRDTTRYPPGPWTRNDLALTTNGRTWVATGPQPCPAGVPAPCPQAPRALQRVVHRPPFDQSTPMPTDTIVPMTVLAAADRVHVIGPGTIDGRAAVAVRLSYQDATPLLAYLHFLGDWRPFYPQDRVVVWLDRATWFPLSYQVYPGPGAERARWAAQAGLGAEPPSRPVFSATVRSFSRVVPSKALFVPPGPHSGAPAWRPSLLNEGFVDLPLSDLGGGGPHAPPRPSSTGGLRPVRYGELPPTEARPYRETEVAYANGLAWATVTRVTDWTERSPFGVGRFAQAVRLPGGGRALYEPATSSEGRRLSLHTPEGEILLSTNLPLASLERLAASLSVRALPVPLGWRVHRWSGGVVEDGLPVPVAMRRAGFEALVPSWLPPGYRPASAELVRTPRVRGVTVDYRRPAAELDGVGLLLYQAAGQGLSPPTSVDEQSVTVAGTSGRWSPSSHELEWVSGGIYRSLTGPALELTTLLRVAASMRGVGSR